MNSYEELVERINEIISEDQNVFENDASLRGEFTLINHFRIRNSHVDEFKRLLDIEYMWHDMVTNRSDYFNKNKELIMICHDMIKAQDDRMDLYTELYNILSNTAGKSITELSCFLGYYVSNDFLDKFKEITSSLKVGPFIRINSLGSDETKNRVDKLLQDNKEQYKRIKNNLNVNNRECEFQDSKFKTILELGISSNLTLSMVQDLRSFYNKEDFEELINELEKWQLFTSEELDSLKEYNLKDTETIDTLDKLISFFATREDLDIQGLKVLIPTIGEGNYNELIDGLFKVGKISWEDYKSILFELLDEDFSR